MECWEHRPFPKLLPAAAQRLKLWANTVWKTTFRLSLLTCLDIEGLVAAASCTLCNKKFMVDNITFLHLAQYETIIFTMSRPITLRKMVGPSRIILLRRMREQLCLLDPGVPGCSWCQSHIFQVSIPPDLHTLLYQPQQCPAKISHMWTCPASPAITWWSKTSFLFGNIDQPPQLK